jgi:uncharacterized protein YqgC (DUF456 family)
MNTLAMIIAIIMFIVGFAGTVLPILPGVVLVYGGMIVYGLMTGIENLGPKFYIIQGLATILILGVDFVAASIGTKKYKGSKQAAFGAFVGTIVGLFTLGPFGILIGPFAGAMIVELIQGKDMDQAFRSGFGTVIGNIGGTIFKLLGEIVMIAYFFIKVF